MTRQCSFQVRDEAKVYLKLDVMSRTSQVKVDGLTVHVPYDVNPKVTEILEEMRQLAGNRELAYGEIECPSERALVLFIRLIQECA